MGQQLPNELKIAYDQENDVLYVSVGDPKDSLCQTLENGVVIKRDPGTGGIIGLILVDVKQNFASTHPRRIAPGLTAELVTA